MAKVLPPSGLTQHLQWNGVPIPKESYVRPLMSIDDIFRKGGVMLSANLHKTALYQMAMEDIYPDGLIASLPELVEMQVTHTGAAPGLLIPFMSSSEELMGVDTRGMYTRIDGPLILVFHGAGLVTPDREEDSPDFIAKFTQDEFDELVSDGFEQKTGKVPIFSLNKLKELGKVSLPRYGVAVPYDLSKILGSGPIGLSTFTSNPLVIARAGGEEFLERYFNAMKAPFQPQVAHEHVLSRVDFNTPRGVVLESAGGFTIRTFTNPTGIPEPKYWVVRGHKNG